MRIHNSIIFVKRILKIVTCGLNGTWTIATVISCFEHKSLLSSTKLSGKGKVKMVSKITWTLFFGSGHKSRSIIVVTYTQLPIFLLDEPVQQTNKQTHLHIQANKQQPKCSHPYRTIKLVAHMIKVVRILAYLASGNLL